jgi:hypothetical protein
MRRRCKISEKFLGSGAWIYSGILTIGLLTPYTYYAGNKLLDRATLQENVS